MKLTEAIDSAYNVAAISAFEEQFQHSIGQQSPRVFDANSWSASEATLVQVKKDVGLALQEKKVAKQAIVFLQSELNELKASATCSLIYLSRA